MRIAAATLAVIAAAFHVLPASAGAVTVPAGTIVLLRFETSVDSGTIKQGAPVTFTVATDVLIDRTVVFRQGTPAQGVVTNVSKPGIFGKNGRVYINYIEADATDGRPVRLSPLEVTPDSKKQAVDVGAAGATAITGAILLGPIGLAAGALVRGGDVSMPAGAVGTSSVAQDFQASLP